jgi:hypothetical protein
MNRFLGNLILGALIILLTAGAASAQLSTAELSGRVTDTSGAVLPGVTIDLALSRNVDVTRSQTLELRLESFNLLNHFNWGNPATNLNLGTFGRITAIQGTPRILQFGLKYGF